MTNTTNKGAWEIKNTVLPLDNPTTDENAPEIAAIERAAIRLGAEADGYDLDPSGRIDGVSVTGPADAIEALVGLFTGDDPAGATTPLVIPTIDFFEAHNLVNALSENEGNDAAIIAIENWLDENAAAAAEDYARRGYADLAADILEIYGGEGDDDWADVTSAIDAARHANEEEPAADDDTNEEPEKIILDADEYDGARLNSIIDCRGYDASAINVYDPSTREETIWVAGKDRAAVIAAYAEDRTTEDFFLEAEVAAWKGNPANEDLNAALEANARDTNDDPNNLYRAGVFAGLAEAAAWMIYSRGICPDDINAINAAVYKAYGVAW